MWFGVEAGAVKLLTEREHDPISPEVLIKEPLLQELAPHRCCE